jgi:restriction endonuclease S subunit
LFAKPFGTGEIVYLQARHFDQNGELLATLHPDLQAEEVAEKHLLQPGDVLFAAKGTKNFAAVYEQYNPQAVASTSFFVIKLFDRNVLPHYLAWFLNSPTAQTFLKGHAIGTSLPSISKTVLEHLEIPIPEKQTQLTILKIIEMRRRETTLKHQIETLREKLIQQTILNAIQ